MPNFSELSDCLAEARKLVARPENDFSWSSWADAEVALEEIDAIVAELRNGRLPAAADIIFLPTGPLQELSLSSGWGDTFLKLADWYDEAIVGSDCKCFSDPALGAETFLGPDARFGESSIIECRDCGQEWLKYLYEMESVSKSGRWCMGALPRLRLLDVSPDNARGFLEELPWYFAGGSYFDGKVSKQSGPLNV